MSNGKPRVLILSGGFGGMYAALEFERALERDAKSGPTKSYLPKTKWKVYRLREEMTVWRTIYLLKLPRFEKKVLVALDWTLDVLFSKDLVYFRTHRPSIPPPTEEA